MKIVKKGRYILHAPWHSHNGKEVEVIMKRKGVSDSFSGKMIFHVAFDPDEEFRSENFDEEFLEEHFRPLEEMTCVLDTTMANGEIIERFKPYYKILKNKMSERINVIFTERNAGDPPIMAGDYLCIFYLIEDANGNPGLTLDADGKGEIMIMDDEETTGVVLDNEGEVKENVDISAVNQRRKKK
jgi:hypothetical protein